MISNREIQLISFIIMFWFILYGQANSLDCRRHVFAPGCRGIVAKRTHNLHNGKFETQTSKTIESDGSQSLPSSSTLTSSLSPSSDEDLIDQPESIQLKPLPLPLVFLLNRANRLTTINSDYNNNNNNPMAWLFSLTPSTGSSNYVNSNSNAIPLTSIMVSDHQNERQSNGSYD